MTWQLRYQITIILGPGSAKNGETLWVRSKTRKTAKAAYSEKVLHLGNNSSFLRIDHNDDAWKITHVFAEKDGEYLLMSRIRPGQFAHLCSLYVDLDSTLHGKYIYLVLLALLPDKYNYLLTMLKNTWVCSCQSPKIRKDDFEAAVVSATNKVSPDSVITGCNFHFSQCLQR
jgi:hypothetical protein